MPVTIKTDYRWHDLEYREAVPKKILELQFSHLKGEDEAYEGFFRYRNYWYHLSDFVSINNNEDLKGWDGYSSDSYFSGVIVKLSKNGDQYQVGTYYS